MNDLRLQTLPGLKIPPPYQLRFAEDDAFSIVAASAMKMVEAAFEGPETPTIESARTSAMAAFEGLHRELLELLCEGIKCQTGSEWFDFWNNEDRLDTFHDLFDGLRALERKIGELGGKLEFLSSDESSRACREQIVEALPGLEAHLVFIEQLLTKSNRIANQLVRESVRDELQAEDSKYAADYNWSMSWALVGLNTVALGVGSHDDTLPEPVVIESDVLGAALAAARQFALEAHHAVREGQRLRRRDQEDEGPVDVGGGGELVDDADLADVEESISAEELRSGR